MSATYSIATDAVELTNGVLRDIEITEIAPCGGPDGKSRLRHHDRRRG